MLYLEVPSLMLVSHTDVVDQMNITHLIEKPNKINDIEMENQREIKNESAIIPKGPFLNYG